MGSTSVSLALVNFCQEWMLLFSPLTLCCVPYVQCKSGQLARRKAIMWSNLNVWFYLHTAF